MGSRLAEKGDATELYLAFGEALYPKEVFEQSRQLMTEAAKTVTAEDLKRFVILAEGIKGFDASVLKEGQERVNRCFQGTECR